MTGTSVSQFDRGGSVQARSVAIPLRDARPDCTRRVSSFRTVAAERRLTAARSRACQAEMEKPWDCDDVTKFMVSCS